ncbi:MAG: DNA repair protein RadC [Clostridia bacterium]|nr:DNA repair protein RadC [Clostridia bacterium]
MEHDGHRERLRQRFISQGLEGFEPHEVLELMLTYAIPRVNTNPIAHRLLSHFGSFHRVLQAHPRELMQVEGIGSNAATLLSMLVPMFRRYQQDAMKNGQKLENYRDLSAYCATLFLGAADEHLYLLCFDAQLRLLATELIARGTPDEVKMIPRQIVQALLRYHATGAVICHNHPGFSLIPSQEDVDITSHVRLVLEGIGIRLYDHILVAGDQTFSFCQHGYLEEERPILFPLEQEEMAAEKPLRKMPPRKRRKENP